MREICRLRQSMRIYLKNNPAKLIWCETNDGALDFFEERRPQQQEQQQQQDD